MLSGGKTNPSTLLSSILGAAAAVLCVAAMIPVPAFCAGERSGTFTILHTNDLHGRYLPFEAPQGNAVFPPGVVGGLAYLSSAIEEIRKERGASNVILIDAGDAFGDDLLANLTHGENMVCAMNAMGYQFMALGDRDFGYGVKQNERLQEMAKFPMRGANVIVESTGEAFLGQPALIFSVGGLRVGMLALGCHSSTLSAGRDATAGLTFTKGTAEASNHVSKLRSSADVVVVVSHMGSDMDRVLARDVPGIDIIIGAHSHESLTEKVVTASSGNGVWMSQALSNGVCLGEMSVTVENGKVASVASRLHVIRPGAYKPEPAVSRAIERSRSAYRPRLEEILATAARPIERKYRQESAFDKLACSALRQATGAQIAFLPGNDCGVALGPGTVTREQLVSLIARPSPVVTMTLRGSQVREILEKCAANLAPNNPVDAAGGLIQTDGLRWTMDPARPMWNRVRDVSVGGRPLDDDGEYTIVTNNALLQGRYRYTTFMRGAGIRVSRASDLETLEKEFKARGAIAAPQTGDITILRPGAAGKAAMTGSR